MDWAPFINPILAACGLVIGGFIVVLAKQGIAAFEARTQIQLTDQQRAQMLGAVSTAVGVIQTKLDQGVLRLNDIRPSNEQIQTEANLSINSVIGAATKLGGVTTDTVARMIVARVDTSPQPIDVEKRP